MGGDDAPESPDYSEFIGWAKDLFKYASGNSKEMMDWAKSAYADNKATSDIFTDKMLGEMDKQIADSDRYRSRLQTLFEPLEEQLAQEAQDYASPERQEYEAGKAEADVAAQFEQARRTAQDRLEGFGVDPSQVRSGALDLGSRLAEASAQAGAGNVARERTEATGRELRDKAIAVGQGYRGDVRASSSTGSQEGATGTNAALATTASGAQTMGTPQTWAQVAGNQPVTAGNLTNTGYQNQLQQFQADQNASSGWGGLLGTVAGSFFGPVGSALGGAAGKYLTAATGGAIPDDLDEVPPGEEGRYLPPEMSPSGGAIPDDIPADIPGVGPAQLNAGEFVMPQDVVSWLGEKGLQQIVLKARKEMNGGEKTRPAQPEVSNYESVGAIPGG